MSIDYSDSQPEVRRPKSLPCPALVRPVFGESETKVNTCGKLGSQHVWPHVYIVAGLDVAKSGMLKDNGCLSVHIHFHHTMADFKTHICVSTVAGAFYAVGGYQAGLPWESCVIGGALCSVSGMLPDLDSDSGIPLREAVAFSSAFVPMLMVDRLQRIGCNHEMMLLITVAVYFFLRFGLAEIFRRYTVHRGMWHSVPAGLSAALFAFLVCSCENMNLRLFKTVAIFIGFMSHILLDEIWSVEYRRGRYMFKHSFGTALKFWSGNRIANIFSYALLTLLCILAYKDEGLMSRFDYQAKDVPHTAVQWIQAIRSMW